MFDNVLIVGKDPLLMSLLIKRSLWQSPPVSSYVTASSTYAEAKEIIKKQKAFSLICIDDFVSLSHKEESSKDLLHCILSSSSADAYLLLLYDEHLWLVKSMKVLEICEFPQDRIRAVNRYDLNAEVKLDKDLKIVPLSLERIWWFPSKKSAVIQRIFFWQWKLFSYNENN